MKYQTLITIQNVFGIIYNYISLIKMKVELIDKMGNELSVVNAARVYYAKVNDDFDTSDE